VKTETNIAQQDLQVPAQAEAFCRGKSYRMTQPHGLGQADDKNQGKEEASCGDGKDDED